MKKKHIEVTETHRKECWASSILFMVAKAPKRQVANALLTIGNMHNTQKKTFMGE